MQSDKAVPERGHEMPRWKQLLTDNGLLEQVHTTFPISSSAGTDKAASKMAVIQDSLAHLTEPGQVVELRVLGMNGKKRTDSGYFNDLGKLAQAALSYDGRAEGIYFTINPVNPALLARANNRVRVYADHTTSDPDILKRITLPIDFDPVRPAGISANADEKRASLERAWACRIWLASQGWPEPVFADSGNGAHLLYALTLPNTAESSELVKRCLLALSILFSDDQVKVDTSTGNASRIFKLYGTLARKGDNTAERPHRRAAIIAAPAPRLSVSQAQLEVLAAHAPLPSIRGASSVPQPPSSSSAHKSYGKAAFDKEIAVLAAAPAGNRNNQLFRSAAALFSLVAVQALDQSEVWQTLLSTAQAIGLSDQEAQRTIQSAAKHGLSQPRLMPKPSVIPSPHQELDIRQADPASDSSPVPTQTMPSSTARPIVNTKVKTSNDLLMHVDELDELPPIRWLINEYLPEDCLVEVYGAPSSGKTQVVFDMAQTLAAAGQTVVYVVAEGLRGYRARKKAWQQFRKQKSGNLFIWREPVQLFEASAVRLFIEAIKPKQPVLVVFDTLSRCSLGADENNQKDMGFILESLDRVRRETGATVLAVHHTNAAGGRERGSTVVRGGMSVMLEVAKEDDLIAVSCAKVKDSGEFSTLFLKPVLVDIGEAQSVPVLIPAEKRVQTPADRLSTLQLDILRAVGMEMFSVSGIKSSQLDELLPPTTKRASKYHSLNTLIRLGYVEPHIKGDPYQITEAGRLKLSTAENAALTSKSNVSKASLTPFIWTLPDSCPMSSPIPHTCGCGMDKTLDNESATQTTTNTKQSINVNAAEEASHPLANVQGISVRPPAALEHAEHGSRAAPTQPPSAAMDASTLNVSQEADHHAAGSSDRADSQKAAEAVKDAEIAHVDDADVAPTVHRIIGSVPDTDAAREQGAHSEPMRTPDNLQRTGRMLFDIAVVPAKYSDAWKHHPDFTP
ncbi:MAG: AAA family ATPase [Aggregatilineales bacterium]